MAFPTTNWSALAKATLHGDEQARGALESLCRDYWSAVHAFIRSRGVIEAEAQDLTQRFLAHVVEKSLFSRADPLRGRFRSFLLGALVRFLRDAAQKREALKRGGGVPHVSLEGSIEQSGVEPSTSEADKVSSFDREWALSILERALGRIRSELSQNRPQSHYTVLKTFLPTGADAPSYEQAASDLRISASALRSEVHRLRLRFRDLVRQEVAKTVSAPHEVVPEMDYLQSVLLDKGSQFSDKTETPRS
ncbi:MAG: hypothetical protein C5B50_29875 [Verrucomicrobia bacterium]|nr:MAG: hypothetical protein C5B50_29875 [Verrucomicrobiota bacterium]